MREENVRAAEAWTDDDPWLDDSWNAPGFDAEPWTDEDPWLDADPWVGEDAGEPISIKCPGRSGIGGT